MNSFPEHSPLTNGDVLVPRILCFLFIEGLGKLLFTFFDQRKLVLLSLSKENDKTSNI